MNYFGLSTILSFIEEVSGIHFGSEKEDFLNSRLTAIMNKYNFNNYHELILQAKHDIHGRYKREIIDAITINETSFFRDKSPFETLTQQVIPQIAINKKAIKAESIDILCAGCSTGQEVYSIAMTILEGQIHEKFMPVRIVGGDICQRVLDIAQKGWYSQLEIERGLTPERINRFFVPQDNGWRIGPELKSVVNFVSVNLLDACFPAQLFDVIFCRNVLIYFTEDKQIQIIENLAKYLNPHGILFVGSTEILDTKKLRFNRTGEGGKTYYQLK